MDRQTMETVSNMFPGYIFLPPREIQLWHGFIFKAGRMPEYHAGEFSERLKQKSDFPDPVTVNSEGERNRRVTFPVKDALVLSGSIESPIPLFREALSGEYKTSHSNQTFKIKTSEKKTLDKLILVKDCIYKNAAAILDNMGIVSVHNLATANVLYGIMTQGYFSKFEVVNKPLEPSGGQVTAGTAFRAQAEFSNQSDEGSAEGEGVISARFYVVWYQKKPESPGKIMRAPIDVLSATSSLLKELYVEARSGATILKTASKAFKNALSIFLRPGEAAGAMAVNPVGGNGDDNGSQMRVAMISNGPPQPRRASQNGDDAPSNLESAWSSSWYFIATLSKYDYQVLYRKLQQNGSVQILGTDVTALSPVHQKVVPDALPIYFNEGNRLKAEDVPNGVLCCEFEGVKDYCCIRPVSYGKNQTAVNAFDPDWEVRESIVRVRASDKDLLQKLEDIGYYELEPDGNYLGELKVGSVVMGRHELTERDRPDTTLDVEFEFRDGFLCLKEPQASEEQIHETSVSGQPTKRPPNHPVVSSSGTYDEKEPKKMKTGDDADK